MSIPVAKQYIKDFEQMGLGVFVHFGIYSLVERGEWYSYYIKKDPDKVAEYKAALGMPISVPEREKRILEKVSELAGKEYAADILPVFKAIFAASCHREERKINLEAHA